MPTIVVHGGAGGEREDERAPRAAGVARAADAGAALLARGTGALEAVIAAVIVLEDDPHFNAGLGSVLTDEGYVEMDASVMEGAGLRAGAVGVVRGVANPVRAAHAVLVDAREVLLVGPAVTALAQRHGLRIVDDDALVTPQTRARRRPPSGETVGAVAVDAHGSSAAATSTGGVTGKRSGRIGDSAIIGAGTYADDALGAVSATGPGEAIIRVALAREVLAAMAAGPEAAAAHALDVLRARTGALAGLIVVAPDGTPAVAFTTAAMPTAIRRLA